MAKAAAQPSKHIPSEPSPPAQPRHLQACRANPYSRIRSQLQAWTGPEEPPRRQIWRRKPTASCLQTALLTAAHPAPNRLTQQQGSRQWRRPPKGTAGPQVLSDDGSVCSDGAPSPRMMLGSSDNRVGHHLLLRSTSTSHCSFKAPSFNLVLPLSPPQPTDLLVYIS